MSTIYYLPLEPYKERYTWQLQKWTEDRFRGRDIRTNSSPVRFIPVMGQQVDNPYEVGERVIKTGGPLDCHQRTYWALTQTAKLVQILHEYGVQSDDIFYFQDMYHPGIEAIPYIARQCGATPKIFVINWAQSVDAYDFTFPMRSWMRPYELMVANFAAGIFVASSELKQLSEVAMYPCPVHRVGLPFDSGEVRSSIRADLVKPWALRKKRVVFTSRWDTEKQPQFFTVLVSRAKADPALADYEFAVCTGNPELRSNDLRLIGMAQALVDRGTLTLYTDLYKERYYAILADSQLHFHCSLQDWVSFTLLEASAFNTPSLCPAFRSFPEALNYEAEQMYVPWSLDDAYARMKRILLETGPLLSTRCARVTDYHDGTLDRHIDIMLGGKPRN